MKIWLDDVRLAPDGYIWCKSVYAAKFLIKAVVAKECDEPGLPIKYLNEAIWWGINDNSFDAPTAYNEELTIELIDMDHDAGDYAKYGGDYIALLDWLEAKNLSYPIRIHSMNPVGVQNMKAIIEHNGWTLIS